MINTELTSFLQKLFDYYNKGLFNSQLKKCRINLFRNNRSGNSFKPEAWTDDKGERFHEINLNLLVLEQEESIQLDIALVHNMIHVYLYDNGYKKRPSYHPKFFAKISEEIGLPVCSGGKSGRKRTGYKIQYSVPSKGLFKKAHDDKPKNIRKFKALPDLEAARNVSRNKTNYRCPCGVNISGKPRINANCDDCKGRFMKV